MGTEEATGNRQNLLANIILLTLRAQTGTANLPWVAIDEPLNLRYT